MRFQKTAIIFFLAVLGCVLSGAKSEPKDEDFFFEKKTQTFIDGEPTGPPKVMKVWLKGDRIRYQDENEKDRYVLIIMDKGKTYELDTVRKTFKETPDEMAKLKEMSERSMVISKRTGRKKKIEKWNCYEIILDTTIQGKKMKATCWLTEEIDVSSNSIQKIAKFSQMKLMEELAKFPGYPVKMTIESSLQGKRVTIVSALLKISKKPFEPNFLKIPFDYTNVSP